MKRQPTEWKKVSANYFTSDEGLPSKIYFKTHNSITKNKLSIDSIKQLIPDLKYVLKSTYMMGTTVMK